MARIVHLGCLPPRRHGAVLVLVAVSLVLLLGVAALSVDGGRMYQERRNVQAAADAAAEAAAIELYQKYADNRGVDLDGVARASALAVAAANGYPATGSSATVTVNIPPASGPHDGEPGFAEVVIVSHIERTFSGVFGNSVLDVSARAVGAGAMVPTKGSILVLDPKGKDTLKLKKKSSSIEVDGDIFVNSGSKDGIQVDKKAQLIAKHVLVAGGIDRNSKRNIQGEILTNVPPVDDPWRSLPTPAKGSTLDPNHYKTHGSTGDVFNLVPGTYKELKFDNNDVVRMSPGIYYIDGGEFCLKDRATLAASGVMIYSAGNKNMKFYTTGAVAITPPTSGTYEGISIFKDRNYTSKIEFKKDNAADLQGVIYAPNAGLKFQQTDTDIGNYVSYEDDPDFFTPPEEGDDGLLGIDGSIGASIVSKRLFVEDNSHLRIRGANINIKRPILGVVE